jgi:hypothetical protein
MRGEINITGGVFEDMDRTIGYKFNGGFENTRPDGEARFEFSDGSLYEGVFKAGQLQDRCVVEEESLGVGGKQKIIYSGNVVGGKFDGQGEMTFVEDRVVYSGGFKDSFCDGNGRVKFLDTGNLLQAEFRKGMKHGKAGFDEESRGLRYTGEFNTDVEVPGSQDFGPRI